MQREKNARWELGEGGGASASWIHHRLHWNQFILLQDSLKKVWYSLDSLAIENLWVHFSSIFHIETLNSHPLNF